MAIILPSLFKADVYEEWETQDIVKIIKKGIIPEGDIRFNRNIKETIELLRKETNKDRKLQIKLKLPGFSLFDFGGKKKINMNFIRADYMMFDIDHISSEEKRIELQEKLKDWAHFYFRSPSGDGLKFAIKLEEPILREQQFKQTYKLHFGFFLNELDLISSEETFAKHDILDAKTCSPANAPFLSYDPHIYYNEDSHPFIVYREFMMTKNLITATLSSDVNKEAKNICKYIASHPDPLHYDEWIKIGMALANIKNGFDCWSMLTPSENYRDLTLDQLRAKFNTFKNSNITIGTLYYYADRRGYDIKKQTGHPSTNYQFKEIIFIENNNGTAEWYAPTSRKEYDHCFNFFSFLPLGKIQQPTGEIHDLYDVNGEMTEIAHTDISSVSSFKTSITEQRKTSKVFMITGNETAYNRLFEFISKASANRMYKKITGIGHIADNLWNLGNLIIANGHIIPSDTVVESEKEAYLLEHSELIHIDVNRDTMMEGLSRMPLYYPEELPIIMGWLTAQIFYQKVQFFPMLCLHGESGGGKSTLGKLILSFYGITGQSVNKFLISLSGKTTINAVNNLKNNYSSIPMIFDEYKDTYAMDMKAYYDRTSSVKATKSMTDNVYAKEVRGGTIISSVDHSGKTELINRCVYVRLRKARHQQTFVKDIERKMKYFGTYLLEVLKNYNYTHFLENVETFEDYLIENSPFPDTRIVKNHAFIMAGWEYAKKYFPEFKVSDGYWINKMQYVKESVKGDDVMDRFSTLLIMIMKDKNYKGMVTVKEDKKGPETITHDNKEYVWLTFSFNTVLWEAVIEKDKRGSRSFESVTYRTVQDHIRENYPADLCYRKTATIKSNGKPKVARRWFLAVPAEDLDLVEENEEHVTLLDEE